jgi:RNA polymerase sigma factor (sigma-70 family)
MPDAAQNLWRRYATRLVSLARQRIRHAPKRVADEEDLAQSVFGSICRGAAAGRFKDVTNRDELWWLLIAITKQKAVDHIRRETAQKRRPAGSGRMSQTLEFDWDSGRRFAIEQLVDRQPTPEFLAMLDEQHHRLLGLLRDDNMRSVATRRIEGYSVPEIAAELNIAARTVERKLQLIRSKWARELSSTV